MTKPQFFIDPVNEPQGEGNGWHPCAESDAALFEVWRAGPAGNDRGVESFDTRAAAVAYIQAAGGVEVPAPPVGG